MAREAKDLYRCNVVLRKLFATTHFCQDHPAGQVQGDLVLTPGQLRPDDHLLFAVGDPHSAAI